MNELKSPNAPGRPLLRNSSEVDESFVPSIYGRTLHSEAHPQVASPFACNGSQKFGTASNNDSQNWPIINNISTSEFKQEFRYPEKHTSRMLSLFGRILMHHLMVLILIHHIFGVSTTQRFLILLFKRIISTTHLLIVFPSQRAI